MNPPRQFRYKIGQLMAVIADVALLLAASRARSPETAWFAAILSLGVLAFLASILLVDLWVGQRCPHCLRWSLRRMATPARGQRFYRCLGCGGRCKRSRFGPWQDAGGAEDDAHYR